MNRGVTLVETMIVGALFLVLTGIMFAGWDSSAKAWLNASQRADIVNSAQSIFHHLDRSLEASRASSVEIDSSESTLSYAAPGAVAGSPTSGQVLLSTTGELTYERYLVCYWTPVDSRLRLQEYPISATSTATLAPLALSQSDIGQGLNPLSFYSRGGKTIGEGITAFSVRLDGQVLQTDTELTTPKGATGKYSYSVLLRN